MIRPRQSEYRPCETCKVQEVLGLCHSQDGYKA